MTSKDEIENHFYDHPPSIEKQRTRRRKFTKNRKRKEFNPLNRDRSEYRVQHNYHDCAQLKCSPYLLSKPRVGRGGGKSSYGIIVNASLIITGCSLH